MNSKADIADVVGALKPKKALLLLHGYGSNGRDMLDLAEQLTSFFPDVVFVAPNAPEDIGMGMYAWYALPADFSALTRENLCRGFQNTCIEKSFYISKLIDKIKVKYSLENQQIGLWGFSQGGLLALVSALTIHPDLACVIASSSLPLLDTGAWVRSRPPCLLTHGGADDVVPTEAMSVTQQALQQAHVPVSVCLSPDLSHGIDRACQQAAIRFWQSLW